MTRTVHLLVCQLNKALHTVLLVTKIFSEYIVLQLTLICLGFMLHFDRQTLAPDRITAV